MTVNIANFYCTNENRIFLSLDCMFFFSNKSRKKTNESRHQDLYFVKRILMVFSIPFAHFELKIQKQTATGTCFKNNLNLFGLLRNNRNALWFVMQNACL